MIISHYQSILSIITGKKVCELRNEKIPEKHESISLHGNILAVAGWDANIVALFKIIWVYFIKNKLTRNGFPNNLFFIDVDGCDEHRQDHTVLKTTSLQNLIHKTRVLENINPKCAVVKLSGLFIMNINSYFIACCKIYFSDRATHRLLNSFRELDPNHNTCIYLIQFINILLFQLQF